MLFLLSFLGFNVASSVFTTLSVLDECIYIGVDAGAYSFFITSSICSPKPMV